MTMSTETTAEHPSARPVGSSALLGDADVERLASAWLETYLQIEPGDDTVDYHKELMAAKREIRKAVRRAGMYQRKSPNEKLRHGTKNQNV